MFSENGLDFQEKYLYLLSDIQYKIYVLCENPVKSTKNHLEIQEIYLNGNWISSGRHSVVFGYPVKHCSESVNILLNRKTRHWMCKYWLGYPVRETLPKFCSVEPLHFSDEKSIRVEK